jgi:hypothetical protein
MRHLIIHSMALVAFSTLAANASCDPKLLTQKGAQYKMSSGSVVEIVSYEEPMVTYKYNTSQNVEVELGIINGWFTSFTKNNGRTVADFQWNSDVNKFDFRRMGATYSTSGKSKNVNGQETSSYYVFSVIGSEKFSVNNCAFNVFKTEGKIETGANPPVKLIRYLEENSGMTLKWIATSADGKFQESSAVDISTISVSQGSRPAVIDVPRMIGQQVSSASGNQIPTSNQKSNNLDEARVKGAAYAKESNTTWRRISKKDEMTGKIEVSIISNQKSTSGDARVELLGKCVNNFAQFSVTLLGSNGASARVPGSTNKHIPIKYKIDDDEILTFPIPISNFSNYFVMANVTSGNGNKPAINKELLINFAILAAGSYEGLGIIDDKNWRVLVQLDTNEGTVVAKLPLDNPEVRAFIKSCKG